MRARIERTLSKQTHPGRNMNHFHINLLRCAFSCSTFVCLSRETCNLHSWGKESSHTRVG